MTLIVIFTGRSFRTCRVTILEVMTKHINLESLTSRSAFTCVPFTVTICVDEPTTSLRVDIAFTIFLTVIVECEYLSGILIE